MTDAPDSLDQAAGRASTSASLAARAVARLIDFLLLGVLHAVVVGMVVLGVLLGQPGGALPGGSGIVAGAVRAGLGAAINLGYFALLESRHGQTVGKMVMKVRTVDAAGGTPGLEQALRRNVWVAFGVAGVVPFIGGVIGGLAQLAAAITIAVGIADGTSDGRGWHDRLASGTRVVAA